MEPCILHEIIAAALPLKIGVSRTTGSLATCSDIHLATCSFSAFSRRQYSAEYSDDEDDVTASVAGVEVCEVDALLGAAVGFVAAEEACDRRKDHLNTMFCCNMLLPVMGLFFRIVIYAALYMWHV